MKVLFYIDLFDIEFNLQILQIVERTQLLHLSTIGNVILSMCQTQESSVLFEFELFKKLNSFF